MTIRVGVVMDPIESIKPYKDTSFAMMLAAQKRGWALEYILPGDCYLRDGVASARMTPVTVTDNNDDWFELGEARDDALSALDVILMRVDPPFNMDYIYTTYLLEYAEKAGTLVVNRPASLRDVNEKLFAGYFPDCCTPTLVSASAQRHRDFLAEHGDIIVKPLDGMGGASIFRLRKDDPNISVVLETMTQFDTVQIMSQTYIPEISEGDKRVLVIDGEPVPFALARIPAEGESRGNLAAGGRGVPVPLNERDREIVARVAPVLREKGLLFVGLDIIGDYLTEINVTSPTCTRELDAGCNLDISGDLMNVIARKIGA
ncbi:glutathione synthase [Granulosicoccaceae sp. 1_MG-2023]|nr:glutathione synthase [Granulosicoccaceae sp. 1_MG-2023]